MSARQSTPPTAGDTPTSGRLAPVINGLNGQPVDLDFLDSPDVLRAVVLLSQTVLSASYFDEALEVIAEQSLVAINAASLAVSRWERFRGVLRTLINVGELGPEEQRWPHDEVYPLSGHRYAADVLRHGRPYVHSVDDADLEPASMRILQRLGKESQIGVPILNQGAVWGELWASGTDGRRFGSDDVRLLSAVAMLASIAIGRAELFSEVARFAYEDPLTGLANRRRVDETLTGLGGMSKVHRARDTRLHRDVAVKVLRADLARDHPASICGIVARPNTPGDSRSSPMPQALDFSHRHGIVHRDVKPGRHPSPGAERPRVRSHRRRGDVHFSIGARLDPIPDRASALYQGQRAMGAVLARPQPHHLLGMTAD